MRVGVAPGPSVVGVVIDRDHRALPRAAAAGGLVIGPNHGGGQECGVGDSAQVELHQAVHVYRSRRGPGSNRIVIHALIGCIQGLAVDGNQVGGAGLRECGRGCQEEEEGKAHNNLRIPGKGENGVSKGWNWWISQLVSRKRLALQ